jgi:hypothetical protein
MLSPVWSRREKRAERESSRLNDVHCDQLLFTEVHRIAISRGTGCVRSSESGISFWLEVRTNTYDKRCFHVTNRSKRTTEKKDVRFWSVACVVIPATTLLNANAAPLSLRQSSVLWKVFSHLFC